MLVLKRKEFSLFNKTFDKKYAVLNKKIDKILHPYGKTDGTNPKYCAPSANNKNTGVYGSGWTTSTTADFPKRQMAIPSSFPKISKGEKVEPLAKKLAASRIGQGLGPFGGGIAKPALKAYVEPKASKPLAISKKQSYV